MDKIYTDLYSRQLSTYGLENMKKICQLKILIIGLRGLGIEITKNLLLSGVNYIEIYDENKCDIKDMGSNFYISSNDINKRRDEACLSKLKELNEYAEILVYKGNNIIKELINFNLVIVTEIMDLDILYDINKKCRERNIGFIYTLCLGLASSIFVDFGERHIIKNRDDSPKQLCFIKKVEIINGKNVFVLDDSDEEKISFFEYGLFKKFNNVKLDGKIKKIHFISKEKIELIEDEINNIIDEKAYNGGGIIEEVEIPEIISYQSLENKFEEPYTQKNLIRLDKSKKNNEEYLHLSIISLHKYYRDKKSLPKTNDLEECKKIINIADNTLKELKKKQYYWLRKIDKLNELYIERVSRWSKCQLSPICSFIGGIVAQEALKLTGKFLPFQQWFWCDFFESVEKLPENINREMNNSRYDEQISIFGREMHEKLENLNIFLVGAGALGCEYLKNFALNGISCSKKGSSAITVTDNDTIEISNLNRQFLFHKNDVNKSKSKCACDAIKKNNSDCNCTPIQLLINKYTENFFNEDFWMKQNYIFSAVDNLEARNYIDEKCCFFSIPYIDCGTLGTIGSMNVFYPHKTICYRDMNVEIEKEIPFCTLKNFPSKFEHCIEWAKTIFFDIFQDNINKFNLLLNNKNKYIKNDSFKEFEEEDENKKYEKIEILYNILIIYKYKDIQKLEEFCIKYYNKFFVKNICELLQQYPRDYIKEDGTSFWSGNKRPPKIIPFNKNDKFCLLYVNTFVQIFCKIIKMEFNKNDILKVLDSLDFSISFKNNVNFNNELINELKSIDNYNLLNPEIFDKDNDENGHINFMHSISVIRANNYDIEILDIFHTKSISGKIVPALSTTTSSIVGLACIQLYLLVENNINSLKCSNINLGVNFYDSSYPEELNYFKDVENPGPNKLPLKLLSTPFSVWDYIEIKKSLKAKEFISIFENKYGIYIDFITCNQTKIIEPLLIDKNDSDYNMKIEDLYSKNNGIKLDSNRKILELKISASKEDCSILIPSIKYIFK